MNFIEAALLLLKKSRRALTAEQIAEQAESEDLLAKPGKDPQRSIQAALSRELKKGDDSRVAQVGDDRWKLAKGAAKDIEVPAPAKKTARPAAAAKVTKKATTKKAATEKAGTDKAGTDKAATKKATTKKATTKKATTAKTAAKKTATKAKKPSRARNAEEEALIEPVEPVAAVEAVEPEELAEVVETASEAPVEDTVQAEVSAETPIDTAAEGDTRAPGRKRRSRRGRRRRGAGAPVDTAAGAAEIGPDTVVEAATEAGVEAAVDTDTGADDDIEPVAEHASVEVAEVLAPREQPVRAETAGAPAEDELEALYGDELSGTEPGAAFAEYRDAQTEDEDRPMVPEIVANRRDRQKQRERRRRQRDPRERRREARGEHRGESRGEGRGERVPEGRGERVPEARIEARGEARGDTRGDTRGEARGEPRSEARAERAPQDRIDDRVEVRAQLELELPATVAGLATYQPGNVLGQAAVEVLRDSNGQPTRAKQIALMMRKRQLLDGDPEKLWPHVKAALISDEQDHLARGIRPRVVHRGRDQFALAVTPAEPALREAEEVMERAAVAMAAATHAVVKARLSTLGLVALERVAHVLLIRQGWQQIEWIKRAQRSSYAVAEAPEGLGTMLVGVRSGAEPVDRRGVGELRVGIQAKNLPGGLLLSPQPLSDVARQELRRNGPSISLLVGDAFVSTLIQCSIGVRAGHVPVNLVDETFFREVSID